MRQSGGGEIDAALRPNKALPPTVLLRPPPSIAIENCNFTPAPRDCMRKQAVCLHHNGREGDAGFPDCKLPSGFIRLFSKS